MRFLPLLWANLWRKPMRLIFTVLSVLVAFLLFGILAATREAFSGGVEMIGAERLITIHKVSLIQPLPLSYGRRIATVDGVSQVAHGSWLQGYYQDPKNFVPAIAVDETYLDVYPEIVLREGDYETWKSDRTGAVVGKTAARQYGWKLGDRVPIQSAIWQNRAGGNTWDVTVRGIYDSTSRAIDTMSLFMHYEYFDEGRAYGRDTVGWYIIQLADPAQAPRVSAAVDALFQNSAAETKTSTEKAWAQSFLSQIGDIGAIVTGIVTAVFFSMLLVTANTMAQSVRERISELAVLKALGFSDFGVLVLVLSEAVAVTLLGGLLGLGLAWVVTRGMADMLAQFLPAFYLPPEQIVLGVGCAVGLGLLAGLWPGLQGLRLQVAAALRRA